MQISSSIWYSERSLRTFPSSSKITAKSRTSVASKCVHLRRFGPILTPNEPVISSNNMFRDSSLYVLSAHRLSIRLSADPSRILSVLLVSSTFGSTEKNGQFTRCSASLAKIRQLSTTRPPSITIYKTETRYRYESSISVVFALPFLR